MDSLVSCITKYCENFNLVATENFIEKTLQLYNMILVRHGLMIVGFPYGSKTKSYKVLAASLGD